MVRSTVSNPPPRIRLPVLAAAHLAERDGDIQPALPNQPSGRPLPLTRTELLLVLLITAAGFAARFAFMDELAVEHFDEGVYASNLWFPDAGYAYPERHLYAPPLLPAMIEFCLLTFGEDKWVPFLPSLLLGALTVPLAWLAVRNWFDPAAGVAVAAIVSCNDFHILMSRSALTDAPLLFFLLLAVWLASEAIARVDLRIAVAAGLATALAWSTKYNGWLAIVISVSGTVAMLAVDRARRIHCSSLNGAARADRNPGLNDSAIILVVMTVVAVGAWYPVLKGLEGVGGYAAVAENHSRYVVGVSGWFSAFGRHTETVLHYFGPLTLIGGLAGGGAAWLVHCSCSTWNVAGPEGATGDGKSDELPLDRSTWNTAFNLRSAFAIVMLPYLLLVPLLAALASAYGLARCALSSKHSAALPQLQVGTWLCAAWICGLLVASPMYRPYPRLVLPLLAMTWCMVSAWTVLVFRWQSPTREISTDTPAPVRSRWGFVLVAILALPPIGFAISHGTICWQNRTGLAAAGELAIAAAAENSRGEADRPAVDFVIYVYGEPGLFFHLPRGGVPVQPVTDLNFALPGSNHPRVPTFVMTGPSALNDADFATHFAAASDALQEIGVFPYQASDFVLLDDHRPSELDDHRTAEVRLYRVRFP